MPPSPRRQSALGPWIVALETAWGDFMAEFTGTGLLRLTFPDQGPGSGRASTTLGSRIGAMNRTNSLTRPPGTLPPGGDGVRASRGSWRASFRDCAWNGTLNPGKERELSSTRSSTASSEPLRIETIRGPGAGSWRALPKDAPASVRRWCEWTCRALGAVLQGRAPTRLPPLDWTGATPFQCEVWRGLLEIKPGQTTSYGGLARRIGNPRAARAVGAACGSNPIPVLVPCHRVLAASGQLGGFSAGLDWKRRLLAAEGQSIATTRR